MNKLKKIQDLYNRHLFLQAFDQSAEYWRSSVDLKQLGPDELVLGGRLASRLGGLRLSRRLFMEALARDPDNPLVRCYASHVGRRNLFEVLREFEERPDPGGDDAELRASWFATYAVTWACVRDFARAKACIEHARSFVMEDPWVFSCESEVLGLSDCWDEALGAAKHSWELDPGAPYAARSLGRCLIKLGRVEESAQCLAAAAEEGESNEIVHLACWHLCAMAETLEGEELRSTLGRARELAGRLETLAPLADRETRSVFARIRLDIADLSGDCDEMWKWAEEVRSPFYRRMLENRRRNPEGRRIHYPFRRVLQKHDTCLPSSICAVLSAIGINLEADQIAAEITFGGTPYWAAAEWLAKRGLTVRFFVVTPDISIALLRNGIPFVLGLEWESNAHAVAVVGVDESAGTLLVHDPGSFRRCEFLLDGIGENEAPLGPQGMAIVGSDTALLLDQLIPADDADAMTIFIRYRRLLETKGPLAARGEAALLAEKHPTHPLTRYLQAVRLEEDGHGGSSLSEFQHLLNEFPHCLRIRQGLLSACNSQGNTALMREALAGIVERGMLPGVQSEQDWRYPPSTYVCQYADHLRMSGDSRKRACLLLKTVIRREYGYGEGWHVLGDLLWQENDRKGMLLPLRTASCLEENNEHYARAYCDALRDAGFEEKGLRWLENRVRGLGRSFRASGPWISWIDKMEAYGNPGKAVAVCGEALKHHGNSPELLSFAVPFLARMGMWKEAEAGLKCLEAEGRSSLFFESAVEYHRMRGDFEAETKLSEEWVRLLPQSIPARRRCLEMVSQRDGQRAAVALAEFWSEEHPGHDQFEDMHYYWLKVLSLDREEEALLSRRVKRNPEDGWAWRELAFYRIAEYERSDGQKREEMRYGIIDLMSQCGRTAPESPATLCVSAAWLEAQGLWGDAVKGWLKCIEAEPENFYSYRRAWECVAGLPDSDRRGLFRQIEPKLASCVGPLSIARDMIFLLAGRFGVAAAEEAAARWRDKRPNDPDVIEAMGDLLLRYGQGRTDAARALALLESAVEQFPYNIALRFSLVHAFRVLGRDVEAESVLREIIRRHPGNTSAHVQLAGIYERRGEAAEAGQLLEIAAAAVPLDTEVWRARAGIIIREGRLADACAAVREGLQRLPESVHWRETAIDLLFECGDEEGAVEAAREGVVIYPDGAYMWCLLADTLKRAWRFAAPGEVEKCLHLALSFNATLYEAADGLAVIMAEQHRYDEAEKVIGRIMPTMSNPWPARGRLAWIRRERGKKDEALKDMTDVVAEASWYGWGWDRVTDWLMEDEKWEEARRLLGSVPPELRTDTHFRQRRLSVLAKAGVPVDRLNAEWDGMLRDFPERVSIHLERYDILTDNERFAEAAAVLNAIRPVDPDSPYILARMAEVLVTEGKGGEAKEVLLRIWFAEVEESSWPAQYAWEAVRKISHDEDAYQSALRRIKNGKRPTPQAFSLMASHIMGRERSAKTSSQPFWRTWFPGAGAREVMALMDLVDSAPWADGRYRAILFKVLNEAGYEDLVIGYWKRKRTNVEGDIESWSEVGSTLFHRKRYREARKFLAPWRERPGVGMWVVATYILCFENPGKDGHREILSACRDALAGLSHDHCAKYLAHTQAQMCAFLDCTSAFRDTWNKYRGYFTGTVEDGEWFGNKSLHLLKDIPHLADLLEKDRSPEFKRACQKLRRGPVLPSSPEGARSQGKIPWWAWALIIMALCRALGSLVKN